MGKSLVETVMGAVVLAIAAFFLVFAYTSSDLKPVAGYQVTAKFGSVGSLTEGSDVRIGGVKVGSVVRQSIDPKDYRALVTMTILGTIKLPDDTVALVTSDGLLGGKYLRLQIGNSAANIAPGGVIKQTKDALSLEEILGKAIFLLSDDEKPKQPSPEPPKEPNK